MAMVRSEVNQPVKAVCIDIDGTLLDFNACSFKAIQELLSEQGYEFSKEDFDVFSQINDELWARIEKGELTMKDLRNLRFQSVFSRLNIDLDPALFEDAFRERINELAIPVEHSGEALIWLSQRYPMYVATNGPRRQQYHRLELADFAQFFKDCFASEHFQAAKPDPQFFERALNGIRLYQPDIRPREILMIGDSLEADYQGALNAGWQFLWLSPDKALDGGLNWEQIVSLLEKETED